MKVQKETQPAEQLNQRNAFYAFIWSYFVFLAMAFIIRNTHALNNYLLSIGIIIISFIVPMLTFYLYGTSRIRNLAARGQSDHGRYLGTIFIIVTAFAIASSVAGTAVSVLISKAFKEFIYDPFSFSLWLSLAVFGWVFIYTEMAQRLKMNDLINLVGFYLIGGVTLSAVLNPNPTWWNESISYLGMNKVPSSYIFNISIFISGLVLIAFSRFLSGGLEKLNQQGILKDKFLKLYQLAFVVAPVGLMLVGVFHYGASPFASVMHNLSAYTAFGIYALVMVSLYFATKNLSRDFLRINYLLLGGLLLTSTLYAIGYLTLALNEIAAFGIISVWLVLFLRSTSIAKDGE